VRYFQGHVVSRGDVFRVWMKEGEHQGCRYFEAWYDGQWYVCPFRGMMILGDLDAKGDPSALVATFFYAGHVPLFAASKVYKWAGEQG
jgi:hypothetical protein